MKSTNPNAFDQTFEENFIVIHGNKRRAAQGGYPTDQMVEGTDTEAQAIIQKYYGNITSGHPYGNPGFCMGLSIGDFARSIDGYVTLTVKKAWARKFPFNDYNGAWPGDRHRNLGSVGTTGYDATSYYFARFPCPFYVNIALFTNSKKLFEQRLFEKASSPDYWTDSQVGMTTPKTFTGEYSLQKDEPLICSILMYSTCSCNQGGTVRPVWSTDISTYIPPVRRYIWRRFGTVAEEQAIANTNGYNLTDTWKQLCDGKWHLVRPFYVVNSNGKWIDVEELANK